MHTQAERLDMAAQRMTAAQCCTLSSTLMRGGQPTGAGLSNQDLVFGEAEWCRTRADLKALGGTRCPCFCCCWITRWMDGWTDRGTQRKELTISFPICHVSAASASESFPNLFWSVFQLFFPSPFCWISPISACLNQCKQRWGRFRDWAGGV